MTKQDKSEEASRIFVLADTHNRLPQNVKEMAKDADEIWHLGDVCAEAILDELCAVGPRVTVVRGNCDSNFEWPLVVDLVRCALKFRLQHVPPDRPPDDIDVLLHGHTHVPRNERRGNVLFLNPGCVTRPNRGSPPSVAWLKITDGRVDWKLVPLRCLKPKTRRQPVESAHAYAGQARQQRGWPCLRGPHTRFPCRRSCATAVR